MAEEEDDGRRDLLDHRKWLVETDYRISSEADRLLTTLAASALAVSTTVFGSHLRLSIPGGLLMVAWAAFATSLIAALISHDTARDEMRARIDKVDAQLRKQPCNPTSPDQAAARTERRNRLAFWAFITGLVFQLLALGALGVSMSTQDKPSASLPLREGYARVPSPPPAHPTQSTVPVPAPPPPTNPPKENSR